MSNIRKRDLFKNLLSNKPNSEKKDDLKIYLSPKNDNIQSTKAIIKNFYNNNISHIQTSYPFNFINMIKKSYFERYQYNLRDLPSDIFPKIFSYLGDTDDLLNCCLVSKDWNTHIKSDKNLWENMCIKLYNHNVSETYDKYIGNSYNGDLSIYKKFGYVNKTIILRHKRITKLINKFEKDNNFILNDDIRIKLLELNSYKTTKYQLNKYTNLRKVKVPRKYINRYSKYRFHKSITRKKLNIKDKANDIFIKVRSTLSLPIVLLFFWIYGFPHRG